MRQDVLGATKEIPLELLTLSYNVLGAIKYYLCVRQDVRLHQMFDDGQDVVAGALDAAGRDPVLRVVLLKSCQMLLSYIKLCSTSYNLFCRIF